LDVITKVAFGLKLDYFCSATFVEDTRAFFSFATAHGAYPLPKWTWPYSPQYKYEAAALAASERMTAAAIQLIRQKKLEMQMQQEGTSIAMSGSSTPNSFVETMLRREGSSRLSTEILREDMIGQDEQLELDILGNIKIFYIAGAETTAVTLAFAIHFLTQHLNIFQNLQAEADMFVAKHCHNKNGQDLLKMDFADAHNDQDLLSDLKLCEAIMKETLRLTSPANIMIYERENNNDGTIFILSNGLKIFPKDQVLLYLDGLLTDPEYFQDPLTFDPYRWLKNEPKQMELSDQAFLAFGFGPRACPGMLLAYMEGIFALVNIAHRFHLSLACDPSEIKREVIFTAAPNKVPVYLSKRNRAQ
jgi:cytochrome P450